MIDREKIQKNLIELRQNYKMITGKDYIKVYDPKLSETKVTKVNFQKLRRFTDASSTYTDLEGRPQY